MILAPLGALSAKTGAGKSPWVFGGCVGVVVCVVSVGGTDSVDPPGTVLPPLRVSYFLGGPFLFVIIAKFMC